MTNKKILLAFFIIPLALFSAPPALAGEVRGTCTCNTCAGTELGETRPGGEVQGTNHSALEIACANNCRTYDCSDGDASDETCVTTGEIFNSSSGVCAALSPSTTEEEGVCCIGGAMDFGSVDEESCTSNAGIWEATGECTSTEEEGVCCIGGAMDFGSVDEESCTSNAGIWEATGECTSPSEPTPSTPSEGIQPIDVPNPLGITNVPILIGRIVSAALGVIGSLALLMFIYGGFLWLLSQGNSQQVEKGKKTILWASLGLVIVFGAYAIINFIIGSITGAGREATVEEESGVCCIYPSGERGTESSQNACEVLAGGRLCESSSGEEESGVCCEVDGVRGAAPDEDICTLTRGGTLCEE